MSYNGYYYSAREKVGSCLMSYNKCYYSAREPVMKLSNV